MKTTIVITGLGVGGAERFLTKLLPLEGVDVVCITSRTHLGDLLSDMGVRVTYLNHKPFFLFRTMYRLYAHLRANRTSLLMTFLIHADIIGRFVGLFARVPVVCNIRNDYRKVTRLWLVDKFSRFLVRSYIVNSPALSGYMSALGVRSYEIIPNGVSLRRVRKKKVVSGKTIICVARLTAQKDHATLLRSLTLLPSYTLLLVGTGALQESLRRLSQNLGISDMVLFLGHRDDVAALVAGSDVFVLPSLTEGMSNALLEAMSVGAVCVVSDIAQNKALIKHKENGLTFKVGNHRDLAKKIQLAKKEFGLNAKKDIKNNYDIKNVRKKYEKLFKSFF